MSEQPHIGPIHKFGRKVVPLRARKTFVTTVERITRRTWKAGTHHRDVCSDPPPESCSDAECPVHGEPEWDSEDSNASVAAQEAAESGTPEATS